MNIQYNIIDIMNDTIGDDEIKIIINHKLFNIVSALELDFTKI